MSTKADWLAAFAGRTVVVIASGPSLTAADCEAVRAAGLPTFVTNTTFRLCPWADVLVAHDNKWWNARDEKCGRFGSYGEEAAATFPGHQFQCSVTGRHGNKRLPAALLMQYQAFNNSGCAAITLAALARAQRVVLLGVDCQRTGGATHWHGDHPPALTNAKTLENWPKRFAAAGRYARSKGCEVVNASRETALACFPRVSLEEEIACSSS